jgi:hypothetical protein
MGGARKVDAGACQRDEILEIFGQLHSAVCGESLFCDANSFKRVVCQVVGFGKPRSLNVVLFCLVG